MFKAVDILYIIDFPYIFIFLLKERKFSVSGDKDKSFIYVCCFIFGFRNDWRGFIKFETDYYPQDNNYFTKNMGVVNFHLYDVVRAVNENTLTSLFILMKLEKK